MIRRHLLRKKIVQNAKPSFLSVTLFVMRPSMTMKLNFTTNKIQLFATVWNCLQMKM